MKNTENGTCKNCLENVTRDSVVELWEGPGGRNCPAPGNVYHIVRKV